MNSSEDSEKLDDSPVRTSERISLINDLLEYGNTKRRGALEWLAALSGKSNPTEEKPQSSAT